MKTNQNPLPSQPTLSIDVCNPDIFEDIECTLNIFLSGYSKYSLSDSFLYKIQDEALEFIYPLPKQKDDKKSEIEVTATTAVNSENARKMWEQYYSHPYRLRLAFNIAEANKNIILEGYNGQPKPNQLNAFSAILGTVNLKDGYERRSLWDHLKVDQGVLFKQEKEQNFGFNSQNLCSPSFTVLMRKILMTPCYRDEFAEYFPQLNDLVPEEDFIRPSRLIKPFCSSGFIIEQSEHQAMQLQITKHLKNKPYYAGQYWMHYRTDAQRFTFLFTPEQQASLLAQVNLSDSDDRKRFYQFLSRRNGELFHMLNNKGGLYSHNTTTQWSKLAATLRKILAHPQWSEEFFNNYQTLARKIKLDDIYLAQIEHPRIARLIRKRSFFWGESLYEWVFRLNRETNNPKQYLINRGMWKQNSNAAPVEQKDEKQPQGKSNAIEYILLGNDEKLKNKVIRHLLKPENKDLLENLSDQQLFELFINNGSGYRVFFLPNEHFDPKNLYPKTAYCSFYFNQAEKKYYVFINMINEQSNGKVLIQKEYPLDEGTNSLLVKTFEENDSSKANQIIRRHLPLKIGQMLGEEVSIVSARHVICTLGLLPRIINFLNSSSTEQQRQKFSQICEQDKRVEDAVFIYNTKQGASVK